MLHTDDLPLSAVEHLLAKTDELGDGELTELRGQIIGALIAMQNHYDFDEDFVKVILRDQLEVAWKALAFPAN